MKISFLGAAQTVTGSCYLVETDSVCFAVDCGMHQGSKTLEERNWDIKKYQLDKIDFVLLTHAHIDHSGLLPKLVREGFKKPIYCTEPTQALLEVMLIDSAYIQKMEAMWETKKRMRSGVKKPAEPLYEQEDAIDTLKLIDSSNIKFGVPFEPKKGVSVTYHDAGHILGSAFLELKIDTDNTVKTLVFSGDLGRSGALIMNNPSQPPKNVDLLFLESTYGDRDHKDEDKSMDELAEAISYCYAKNGKVIIPAFAVERTQEIIYTLFLLYKDGRLPKDMPVFLDSPLAIKATQIFMRYPSFFDKDTKHFLSKGENPFDLPNLRYTESTEESQAINGYAGPAIIISASGMCNAGRIKHHLRHNIWSKNNAIVFVGYQGKGTPGRKIVDGSPSISLYGVTLAVKAKIYTIGGFSSHAGQSELLNWVKNFHNPEMEVVLIHGEEKAQLTLSALIQKEYGNKVIIPAYAETVQFSTSSNIPIVSAKGVALSDEFDWDVALDNIKQNVHLLSAKQMGFVTLSADKQKESIETLAKVQALLKELEAASDQNDN